MARRNSYQRSVAYSVSDKTVIGIFRDDRLLGSDHRFSQAAVNSLTKSGADHIPVIYRKHYANGAEHRCHKISDRQPGLYGRAIRKASNMQKATHCQTDSIKTRSMAVRARLSESRGAQKNQSRVHFMKLLPGKTESFENT